MILTNLHELLYYKSVNPGIKMAVEAITIFRDRFSTVPDGRSSLGDSRTFCIKVEGEGRGKDAAPLEAHRAYIDIQYTVEGTDIIGWKGKENSDSSSGYDEQDDIEFFRESEVDTWLKVRQGAVVVFFPNDLHAPMACEGRVKKLVIKIPVL